ncbi:malonate decarboxylase subunit alpha [Paraburkholderia caballeronis]|uniref:Malonate decarboxylase alpha subunit n=1 Tax=Paraburkholderia caballeronis TaxID=416943 RepID=A0A1H7LXC6_9BURK|nr:malonate decarboxylase subunit alpha [Paraburkholderia caballeronis]PXW28637.1 malonate decarboxylase alpha subunit [Paraburkholderia caballeronis]PXX04003.1 malonate decarboxylase alpha subunit [Paraburkholderia caballeronis]RAK04747.1 malonate decarboxylase alpha subunit [Paraburkholderia caballeronis]TDV19648.1 malonate decarboxylase alpha subunit [Paraburkholderia caballeronis]TDV22247.1 malonate decarboxylase alpha subunit [Paraburkholderia caballeronis]
MKRDVDAQWNRLAVSKAARLERAGAIAQGKQVEPDAVVRLLEAVLEPGDRLCIEGNNQKHADFLSACLAKVDPQRVHDLHIVQSNIALPQHLDIFDKGIARDLDFSYSGPQGVRLANLVAEGKVRIGAIHTYLELYGRYFCDLTPRVSFIAAQSADREGNLYTGPNTEDTPAVVESTAFKNGIVIAQVNELVDKVPRVDVPSDWVNFVVRSPKPHYIEPIFTRDPAAITEIQILMAMMVIKGIYAEYGVTRLNHGIGFDTAAIELLLPTYAQSLGLRGKICTHMSVNPCPTLIPAIESGFVQSIHSAGSELGMEEYVAARPDIFFTGPDGSLRSNRVFCQLAGHYSDLFIGSTLQIDLQGNSSTATRNRMTGFGGAPNFGCDSRARRHTSDAWLKAGREASSNDAGAMPRGRKLVVQMVETFGEKMQPTFVERLDAWDLMQKFDMALPPVMVYGDDVTHIVTEEGIANLLLCRSAEEREQAIRGVSGFTPAGLARDARMVEALRARGVIRRPEDIGINPLHATRDLLAARSIKDLVRWSSGLYDPPKRFRNW